jgi:hypothetical protein
MDHGFPSFGLEHRTAGCWGTTGFLRAVLRTVNVPVRLESPDSAHALPHFVREGLFLSHADDPYNQFLSDKSISTPELLIDRRSFNAWFGPGVLNSVASNNVGRRPQELAIKHLAQLLLDEHCADLKRGVIAVNDLAIKKSGVFELLPSYTLAELKAECLWENLNKKVEELGTCLGMIST